MTTPGLRFVLDAQVEAFDRDVAGSSRRVQDALRRMQGSAQDFDQRFGRAMNRGARSGRNMGQVVQQAGFQVGDFAVQIAGGGNALTAFTQQGTQLISMFGPWGAVIGAAGAIVGALATYLLAAGEASEDASKSLDRTRESASTLESGLSGLESLAKTYADAIRETASAQEAATASIIADTKREFEAKKQLLALDQQIAVARQAGNLVQISNLEGQIAAVPTFETKIAEAEARAGRPLSEREVTALRGRFGAEVEAEAKAQTAPLRQQLDRLVAESDLLGTQIVRVNEALNKSFEQIVKEQTKPEKDKKGGGGGSADRDPLGAALERAGQRLEQLDLERQKAGQTAEEQARLTAAYEAQRIELGLLEAAKDKASAGGAAVTPEEQAVIRAVSAEYRTLAESVLMATAAEKAAADATKRLAEEQKDAAKRAEEHARAVSSVADRLTGAITQADSFTDALKRIGVEIANLVAQGISGGGPLGGILGNLGSSIAGSFSSSGFGIFDSLSTSSFASGANVAIVNAKGNAFSGGRVVPFARGGIVSSPTTFPMAGGNMGLMGEAGLEAILPLTRGPGGKLGVQATGAGGGGSVSLTQSFDFRGANVSESTFRRIAREEGQRAVQGLISARRDDPSVLA